MLLGSFWVCTLSSVQYTGIKSTKSVHFNACHLYHLGYWFYWFWFKLGIVVWYVWCLDSETQRLRVQRAVISAAILRRVARMVLILIRERGGVMEASWAKVCAWSCLGVRPKHDQTWWTVINSCRRGSSIVLDRSCSARYLSLLRFMILYGFTCWINHVKIMCTLYLFVL